jgi:myo-inositol-1(or 4)-monophosphatase
MSGSDDRALLTLARDAAEEAATWLAEHQKGVVVTATKSSLTDIVTAADTTAEEMIRATIARARPRDSFLGEESTARQGSSDVRWVVDPIDGTVNYWYGLPTWSVSIAAERDGAVVAGVVHAPMLRRRYTATTGDARCNGTTISASRCAELTQALLATGFSYEHRERARQAAALAEVLAQVRDIRRLGSAALDLCLLAAGEVDLYYERGLAEWDRAAGQFIASQAGATVAQVGTLTLGSSPTLFAEFEALLASAGV